MSNIPLTYTKAELFEESIPEIYFSVTQANINQVKTLITLGVAVRLDSEDGIPLLIENLNQIKFRIKNSLDSYIALYRTFKGEVRIYIKGTARDLCYYDLMKFVL